MQKIRALADFRQIVAFFRIALFCSLASLTQGADWLAEHGNSEHTGRVDETLRFPLTLQWVVEFENERIETAAEPIVANGRVLVPTIAGSIAALNPKTGEWFFSDAPEAEFERFFGFDRDAARRGKLSLFLPQTGAKLEIREGPAPIRQLPAFSDGRIYVTSEDLRLHCFDANSRSEVWTSEQMFGQTARDYYPVIARAGRKKFVVVRTNPVLNMAQQITNDRNFLMRQAAIDGSDWKKLDSWIKSPVALGSAELIAREQDAIVHYLETNEWAQTFYVFDADTGKRTFTPPIMWVGGCQGVGAPPAITKEGKAVVLYRSAYGNWNHGVAPLVAIGLLNFETGRIEPLRHNQGKQPPWNTFWGTADEEQNFTIAGDDLIIVHQGTLARFNLKTHDLETIWGERDTYGGFKNPSWARNEWHGPGRGGVAISDGRIYWITGSRLLCLGPDKPAHKPSIETIRISKFAAERPSWPEHLATIERQLAKAVGESIATNWAPLYVEPGLAGREFFFADSRETFTALAWAYPNLSTSGKRNVKSYLAGKPFPFSTNAAASLRDGARREYFRVPEQALTRLGNDKPAHRFGGVYAACLYAQCCNAWPEILKARPEIEGAFRDFVSSNPNFGKKPELYFNRYLASLIAFRSIVRHDVIGNAVIMNAGIISREAEPGLDTKAKELMDAAIPTLLHWWKDAGITLTNFNGSSELDYFIQKGDKLSWAVFPHRHKLAVFQDLAPEIGDILRAQAPEAAQQVWATFTNLAPTWHLMGEECQYHFGENFIDLPDFALSAFQALAFVQKAGRDELLRKADIPFCHADLYYIQKLAIALDPLSASPEKATGPHR